MTKENKYTEYNIHYAKPEEVKELVLIHYGSDVFKPEKFRKIKNEHWVKPKGGLWTSPVNSQWGWKDWCEAEEFRSDFSKSFKVKLKDWALVAKIDTLEHLENLPLYQCDPERFYNKLLPDFELMVEKGIHAIWLTENGQSETRMPHYGSRPSKRNFRADLYGWDVESVLIMDPSVIVPL